MRVAFVYPRPRLELLPKIAAGEEPDTTLLGQNHLVELGFDAFVHDSVVRRRHRVGGLAHRVTWLAREATLPWELRGADVIVTPLATLLPLAARLARGPRIVYLSYGTLTLWGRAGRARRALVRASVRSCRATVTITHEGRDRLVRELRLPPERVLAIPFGVDARFWQPSPVPESGHVLTVGRDLARDYRTLAAAVDGLPLKVVLVAKEENLRGVSLPDNVDVRMGIETSELRELYAGAVCTVMPIVRDGDPRGTESSGTTALLEAMACGRATIVSDRSSLRDYVDGDASVVVPPEDPPALRAAIARLVEHPDEARRLGEAGRRRVEREHTTRRFAERLAPIVRRAAEG